MTHEEIFDVLNNACTELTEKGAKLEDIVSALEMLRDVLNAEIDAR